MDDRISRVIRHGILLILIAIPLIYTSQLQESFSLPKKAFFQIAIAVLLCLFAIQVVLKPERLTANRTPIDLIILVWLAWSIVATIFSLDRPESVRELIYTSCLVGFFFLVTRNITTYRQSWFLVCVIIIMAVLEASYGIAERLGVKLLYEKKIIESPLRVTAEAWRGNILGTFGNANHLASYLVLSIPLILGCIFLSTNSWWYILIPCLVTVLGCLVLTGARAAWSASFIGIAFLVLFGFRQSKRIGLNLTGFAVLMLAGVIILILLTQPNLLGEVKGRVEESFSISEGTISYRILAWRLALDMTVDRPLFGSGPGTFKLLFLPTLADYLKSGNPLSYWSVNEKMNEPHNEYLQMAVETGVPGLAFFILIVSVTLSAGWKSLRRGLTQSGFLISALLASLIAGLVHAFASIPFHVVPSFITFWAVVAFLFSLLKSNASKKPEPRPKQRAWYLLLAVGLFVFAAVTIHSTRRELSFSYHFKVATNLNHMKRYKGALYYFQRALEIQPTSGRVKFYCGSTLVSLGHHAEGAALLHESTKNFQDIYTYKNLGAAYEAMGRYDKAVEMYRRWREMGIVSHEANNRIALIRLRQGRNAEAEELFKETLEVRPWDWTAHSSLGIIQMESGRLDEAIKTLEPERFQENSDAYSLYGVALLRAGRYEEAAKNFFTALSKNPDSTRARNNLAGLYYRTGDREAAIREWKKVLELDPANKMAQKNLKTALGEKQNNLKED